jgi:putative oxidoreductase
MARAVGPNGTLPRGAPQLLSSILKLRFLPTSTDAQLLFLRVAIGMSIFLKHGYEKIFHFPRMAPTFSDPLHLGSTTSLVFAMLADGICSLLIIFGLGTRWASMFSAVVIFVAWAFNYHFIFFGHYVADHGELCLLYIIVMVALFIGGPGRYSIDAQLQD